MTPKKIDSWWNNVNQDGSIESAPQVKFLSDVSSLDKTQKVVIFPNNYPGVHLQAEYLALDTSPDILKTRIIRFNLHDDANSLTPSHSLSDESSQKFESYSMSVFNSGKLADQSQCPSLKRRAEIEVGQPKKLPILLKKILLDLMQNNRDYYQEITSFFNEENNLEKLIEENSVEKFWFRLAGSAVWLQQHGVYFMTSRILFSPSGIIDKPVFSLLVAHVYDQDWNELQDVELVVPTNHFDLSDETDVGPKFTAISYPTVLPIPFYHNASYLHDRYYGPEDPRILLTKNPQGFEEPLMVFNAHHRKIVQTEQTNENDFGIKFQQYRSMFVAWPWQFQRGKKITEDLSSDSRTDLRMYTRIVELGRKDIPRRNLEKNWTPFINFSDRQQFQHDRYLYFVYRWKNIEVLKCPLSNTGDPSISLCEYEYRMDDGMDKNSPVGELRGGTQMINVNDLLYSYSDSIPEAKKLYESIKDRQTWVGFARAHLKNCGCGSAMYRPNFVVMTHHLGKFSISSVSSFLSLNIPLLNWNEDGGLCDGASVLIPNGIANWAVGGKDDIVDDILTLAYSVSDKTVEVIDIKGILKTISETVSSQSKTNEEDFIVSNDQIDCAMEASKEFCRIYGETIAKEEEAGKSD
jgi:beta-1,2-mannosyltransferase